MLDRTKIKNVVLDIGGVLVDIDEEQTYKAFKRILKPDALVNINWEEIPEIVLAMETGQWSKEKFKETMIEACRPGVSMYQMVDAWCAMLNEFQNRRVAMVKQLKDRYKVYLLSNTNVYHVNFFEQEFRNRYHHSLQDLFERVYYSNEIGMRKPDTATFEYVLKDAGIKAEETVMVDDRAENCEGAEKTGMQTLKVPEDSGLEAVIGELL